MSSSMQSVQLRNKTVICCMQSCGLASELSVIHPLIEVPLDVTLEKQFYGKSVTYSDGVASPRPLNAKFHQELGDINHHTFLVNLSNTKFRESLYTKNHLRVENLVLFMQVPDQEWLLIANSKSILNSDEYTECPVTVINKRYLWELDEEGWHYYHI